MTECLKTNRAACDFTEWADGLQQYLASKKVVFAANGFPFIPTSCFLKFLPDGYDMLPHEKGWFAKENKPKTVLCGFEDDPSIYRHVRNLVKAVIKGGERLERVLGFYRQFYAVCGFDLSVCRNAPLEEQEMFLLLNQLLNAVLAVNGILLVANFRMGSEETLQPMATTYPRDVAYAVGTLGCCDQYYAIGEVLLKSRLLAFWPSQLLIYGSFSPYYRKILDEENIPYRHFIDYRSRTFKKNEEVR